MMSNEWQKKMTGKNQPENPIVPSEASHHSRVGERARGGHRTRRIQHRLSNRDKLILLVVCLNVFGALIFFHVTGFFTDASSTAGETGAGASVPAEAIVGVEITYEEMFQEIAPRYGLDWRLLAQLAYQESRLSPPAVGKDDDAGLMQIVPSTWNEWAPTVGASDPFDPYSNVLVAAAYLAFLREYFSEMGYPEDRWMLVAYNWGPDNLRRLLENDGGWNQIPEKRRRYALEILQSASDTPPGWEEIRDELVARTISLEEKAR